MPDTPALPIDPVCGMDVEPDTNLRAEYQGSTYYFCHPSCLEKFTADPEAVLHPSEAQRADGAAIYTCPMHPEIRQVGPGSCPICGMALEPAVISLDDGPNVELSDMTRRFWLAAALGAPVMLFAMA
jgi:P-type Cu+ transporter